MSSLDSQSAILVENLQSAVSKLQRYARGVSDAEMEWSPPGLKNSLQWILRHCTGLLWASVAFVSGEPIPCYVRDAGIAPSALKSVAFFDTVTHRSEQTSSWLVSELEAAWRSLKELLDDSEHDWEMRRAIFERRERNIWAPLWHFMADIAYHTGQASSLRKLLSVQRRRRQR